METDAVRAAFFARFDAFVGAGPRAAPWKPNGREGREAPECRRHFAPVESARMLPLAPDLRDWLPEGHFAGFCGPDSFMSADPLERDIYVERIYDVEEDNRWISCGEKGLFVAAGEIQTMEFWPHDPEGKGNGQD